MRSKRPGPIRFEIFEEAFPEIDYSTERTCDYCHKNLPISYFDGFSTTCRDCRILLNIMQGEYNEDEEIFDFTE